MFYRPTSPKRLLFAEQYNEPAIVALLKEGNQKAFEELYRRFAPTLLRKLLCLISDRQQAEDLLQDSFVNIWLNFHQYDPAKGRLFTWMARIVRNNALTHLRVTWSAHEPLADSLLDELGGDTPNYYWIGVDYWVQSTLSPHHRQLIQLMYYQGYTYQEASDELGLPIGTVKTRVRWALQRLRSSEAAIATKQGEF
ncbi:RNA polymerase sigma factor [Spirosoma endophyticum]|uniref:RNA polymerase sigma-70 factor, ECF subfamily n=1 Tax=Spirosoma endophyticum TaxID=662367 RepID=A0A1I2GLS7_9BACT|nr:sigma factor [Spirosoma endophyticum]SFF18535.1 RNA polymerase sigma-70 factor, ECF subfamily [Spirosoma endophyticum]